MSKPPYRVLKVALRIFSVLLAIGALFMIFSSRALIVRVFLHPPEAEVSTLLLFLLKCLVPRHGLHFVPRHPLQFGGWKRVRNPALDDRRALDSWVEFPNQSRAVEHHHPLFDRHYLHPLSSQRSADFPLLSLDIQFALAITFNTHAPWGYSQRGGCGS